MSREEVIEAPSHPQERAHRELDSPSLDTERLFRLECEQVVYSTRHYVALSQDRSAQIGCAFRRGRLRFGLLLLFFRKTWLWQCINLIKYLTLQKTTLQGLVVHQTPRTPEELRTKTRA